ncbi:MAG TPA: PhzF family phenazine biosynthesis protein [Terriglobales bacterium]|nr:PhzF family phenazine biosynthesis protein [Terriglobales bacterium]
MYSRNSAGLRRECTPTKDMIFAGHPTVGTAFALIAEGIVPKNAEHFVLEEKVGPDDISRYPATIEYFHLRGSQSLR